MEVDQVVKVNKKRFPNKPLSNIQNKKASKPLMEKKRRERINYSLAELKVILNDSITNHEKVKTKKSKIEKADILEMAVRQFKVIRTFEQSELNKYAAGFIDCTAEIVRFVNSPEILSLCSSDISGSDLKTLLIQHLELCSNEMTNELAEQVPSDLDKEPNNNISPIIESLPKVHDTVDMKAPGQREEIMSPLLNNQLAYLCSKELSLIGTKHISPHDSGDESNRPTTANNLPSPNIVDISDTFLNFSQKYIGASSNYLDYITSFPASIWPYLFTNQYCQISKPNLKESPNTKENISTLEKYIGAAVEEGIHEKPLLQSPNENRTDIPKNSLPKRKHLQGKEKPTVTDEESDLLNYDMPIDYSRKSINHSGNEPVCPNIVPLELLSPMWRPW